MKTDIVERLNLRDASCSYVENIYKDAAAEILRLRAENEKLRAALKPFADKEYAYESWADTARDAVWFNISDLRAAAAALKETE